ncbi:hypothetical protein GGR57DRAFT_402871 [Xylariaceae sp. FL1272]|nr:hypothetical protein GGR57DRAFT_402871 [Xylariaceae sp. FL1272]
MDRPSKRPRVDLSPFDSDDEENRDELSMTSIQFDTTQDPMYQLDKSRAKAAGRLKSTFEDIFAKYGKDFDGDDDTINFYTDEIEIDNGHVKSLETLEVAEGKAATSDEEKKRSTDRSSSSEKVLRPKPFAPTGFVDATTPLYSQPPRDHGPQQSAHQPLNSSFPPSPFGPNPPFNFGGSLFGNGNIDPVWQAPDLPIQAFHYATGHGRWAQYGHHGNSSPYLGPKRLASARSFAVQSSPASAGANDDNTKEEDDDILRGKNTSGVTLQTKEKQVRTGFVGGLITKRGSPEFSGLQESAGPSQSASLFPRRGRPPKSQSQSQPLEPIHGFDKGALVEDSPPPSTERKIEIVLPRLTTPDLEEYRRIFPTPPHVTSVNAVDSGEKEPRGTKRRLSTDSAHVHSVVVPVFQDILQESIEPPHGSADSESVNEVRCAVENDQPQERNGTLPHTGTVAHSTQLHSDSPSQPESTSKLSAMTIVESLTTRHNSNLPTSETGRSLRSQKSMELYSPLVWPKRRLKHPRTATGIKGQSPKHSQVTSNESVTGTTSLSGICRGSDNGTNEHTGFGTPASPRIDTIVDEDRVAGEVGGALVEVSDLLAREESEREEFPAPSSLSTDESAETMSASGNVPQDSNEDMAMSDGETGLGTETLRGPELLSLQNNTSPSAIPKLGDVFLQQSPIREETEDSASIRESRSARIPNSAEMSNADDGGRPTSRSSETRDPEVLGQPTPVDSDVYRPPDDELSENPEGNQKHTSTASIIPSDQFDGDTTSPDLGWCSPVLGQGRGITTPGEDAQRSPSLGAIDLPEPVILDGLLEFSGLESPQSSQLVEEASFDRNSNMGRSPSPELGTASGPEIIRTDTTTPGTSNPSTPKRQRKPKSKPENRQPIAKRLTLTSLIPDGADDDSDELSIAVSIKTPTSRWSHSRNSSPQPSSRMSPRKTGRQASLLSEDRFPSPPATDSRALVGRGKVRSGHGSGVHSSPLARTVAYRLLGTPRRGRREESPMRTPNGRLKKCGQDGYVCDKDFCFTCCK